MTHATEATLVAIRDGALVDADESIHVFGCEVCTDELDRVTARSVRVGRALDDDDISIDIEAAKASVRARLDRKRAAERPRRRYHLPLGRAAALLLVAAGAASALPGSPVREWIGLGTADGPTAPTTATSQEVPTPSGIEVAVSARGITVTLRGVPAAEQVQVVWLDEQLARISAADGSSYTFADGRAEAVVTGGPVSVALPRSGPAMLEINGTVVLSRSGETLTLPLGSVRRDDDGIVLTVPDR